MIRSELIAALDAYQTHYADEHVFVPRFLDLLRHSRAYHRDHLPGHMTGSAWIVDESRRAVLLTHHTKLNRWLQPGGHADGDENIFRVALKEATEETGIRSFKVLLPTIFDLDIHPIPARAGFPRHDHYDVRILLEAPIATSLTITDESHDLAWVDLDDIPARSGRNRSMMRMVEKVRALLTAQQQ